MHSSDTVFPGKEGEDGEAQVATVDEELAKAKAEAEAEAKRILEEEASARREEQKRLEREKKAAEEAYKEGLLRAHPELTGRRELEYMLGLVNRAADTEPQKEDEFHEWLVGSIIYQRELAKGIILGEGMPDYGRDYHSSYADYLKLEQMLVVGHDEKDRSPLVRSHMVGLGSLPNDNAKSIDPIPAEKYAQDLIATADEVLLRFGGFQGQTVAGTIDNDILLRTRQVLLRQITALNTGNLLQARQDL